ncbi:MAG: shikimate dehydrogenase [Candidatus Caldarchaeales archaeon]|jgi:shikimate dehydrogenase|nr:shikimate dehydrogenase [Candidatus Caldarchaeales archaeon]
MELLAVIGYPISHSASPIMYNALFRVRDLPHRYIAVEVPPENLGETLRSLHRLGFKGLNITIPHKEVAAIEAVGLTEEAEAVGAVNTLSREREGWVGHNTDVAGVVGCLYSHISGRDCKALVLGAGGSAAAALYALGKMGVRRAYIANRTIGRAERLAERAGRLFGLSCEVVELGRAPEAASRVEIIVNATPLGLTYSEAPIGERDLTPSHVVLDMVYSHRPTPMRLAAEAAGATYVDGVRMLVEQGAASVRILLGIEPDKRVMEGAVRSWLRRRGEAWS